MKGVGLSSIGPLNHFGNAAKMAKKMVKGEMKQQQFDEGLRIARQSAINRCNEDVSKWSPKGYEGNWES